MEENPPKQTKKDSCLPASGSVSLIAQHDFFFFTPSVWIKIHDIHSSSKRRGLGHFSAAKENRIGLLQQNKIKCAQPTVENMFKKKNNKNKKDSEASCAEAS